MPGIYPATYRDRSGEERTNVENDGCTLRMALRGVEFTCNFWDDWAPPAGTPAEQLASFHLYEETLIDFGLDCDIEVPLVLGERELAALLSAHFEMGHPEPDCPAAECRLQLQLAFEGETYSSTDRSGDFESALAEIQSLLPAAIFLKTCATCAFSDYYPGGQPLFAALACFRGNKAGYRKVKNRWDLFRVWDTRTEQVQEIHLCPEFERRAPGTGYRG